VVGVATSALGLALIVRIKEAYGTIEEDEIREVDRMRESVEIHIEDALQDKTLHEDTPR